VGKKKRDAKTKTRARTATFVRGRHLVIDKAGAPARTLNVVQRAALNPVDPNDPDAPKVRAEKDEVFFKPHHDTNAASQYAVASTRLARFLGMPDLIAHNAFAKVHNVRGAVSGAVPGSPLFSAEKKSEYVMDTSNKQEIAGLVRDLQLQERNGKYYRTSKEIYQWVNFKDPRIQKGMSDLQLFDAISGQVDRHGGNIFVDPKTGTVSGIDDDKSFGGGRPLASQADVSALAYYRALPALVDLETANKILDLNVSDLPNELLSRVNDSKELTDQEIEDAMWRLRRVQKYLQDLKANGRLIGQNGTSWNDATYQAALQNRGRSYLGYQAWGLEQALERSANNDPMIEILDAPPSQPPPPVAAPPPQVMPPPQQRPWQPPSPGRTAVVPPSRAAEVRLAARRVPPPPSAEDLDGSGDMSDDSTTTSADDQLLSEQ
jgi:hypothetical protein